MSLRIRRILIRREGPLSEDFSMEPGSLNLIYGRNETGKTYILEAMISLLFRTGRDTPWVSRRTRTRPSTMRPWDPRGEIEVTGLEEEVTLFTSGSPRLEDFEADTGGLPRELSRLMVVRAGDTRLSDSPDGVGDELLRTYLSGNSILDEVEANIAQETVKSATVTGGRIEAENKGLHRERQTLESELRYLDELQMAVDENASLSTLSELERQRDGLSERLAGLEDAKRHRAFQLYSRKGNLEAELERLPAEEDISDLGTDISLYRTRLRDLEHIELRLEQMAPANDDLKWLEAAGREYKSSGEARGHPAAAKLCRNLLPILVLLAAAGAFFSRVLTLVSSLAAALCLGIVRFAAPDRNLSGAEAEGRRLLEEEFQRRFQRTLSDPATIEVVRQELEEARIRYAGAEENREETLRQVRELRERIERRFYLMEGTDVPVEDWNSELRRLGKCRKDIQDSIAAIAGSITAMGISPEESLADPPGLQWDQKEYLDIKDRIASLTAEVDRERKSLEDLKMDISVATGVNSRDIRDLITALELKSGEIAGTYRKTTARILAENSVYRAVCEFRDQENARLEKALGSPEIVNSLHLVTGKYSGICMNGEGGLTLRVRGNGQYPLSHLSTGAAEQVHIALRTGFAQLYLGEPAFLLLDDAFQHSDWDRRKNLVDHMAELVSSGWQVFYFTMDDHISKLLQGRGSQLAEGEFNQVALN